MALTAKDLVTDQDIRWCPGCGDYSILKQVQSVVADLGRKREDIVFISGIGCSSRFPYYMDTYGMHSIHGRATAIASGLKAARPELDVWIITGDGDSLSIGGNHLIHLLRRNFDVNILLFNNEIYGLTKGQYSPTSHEGKVTKSSPFGVLDHAFNPSAVALGADSSFFARTLDRDPKHMKEILKRGNEHKGASLIEIYQNCNVFNDGAFFTFTDKETKAGNAIFVEHNQPLIFGNDKNLGIKLDGFKPVIVNLDDGHSLNDLWIHDEQDYMKATLLSRMFDAPSKDSMPRPFGVFYSTDRGTYESAMEAQIAEATEALGKGDLDSLLAGNNTWVID
ncbi:MAG: 2-oxoacid:ferredoxin oxidoreductase subunit beta [Crocinitomicaceae bacterium]|nr:2-oxoacid:ferredoxin oxidoreductase subunit beta [Crocinitomicaceae bacterium]|tara:strand:- start:4344 stop:5351 length:1008 start_codon:yes stop_codon:yes gene_type:complete